MAIPHLRDDVKTKRVAPVLNLFGVYRKLGFRLEMSGLIQIGIMMAAAIIAGPA